MGFDGKRNAREGARVSPGAVLLAVCLAQYMVPAMVTAVGVALPAMGRELHATAQQLGLIEQVYTLSLAMTMLAFGRLGDLVGRKRLFLIGMTAFAVVTCSLGFTESVTMFIAQRFVQGLSASILLSGSLALVASVYPPAVRGRMIGLVSAFTYAGLSTGPVLGGFITTAWGWRYVFFLCAPLALAGLILCLTRVRTEWREEKCGHMDWRGSALYAASVALFMLGASHLGTGGSGREVGAAVVTSAGLAGLCLLWLFESRLTEPLLDVNLLRQNRYFTLSCLAAFGNYAATFGVTFLMSLFLQYVKGFSPRQAGFVLLAQPLVQMVAAPLSGRLAERLRPVAGSSLGILLSGAGLLAAVTTLGPESSIWWLVLILVVMGAGFGLFITPNSTIIMGSVDRRRFGMASGMVGAMRTLGMVTSMTIVTMFFSLLMGSRGISPATVPDFLTSMRWALSVFTALSLVGLGLSLGRRNANDGQSGQ